jgi:hypothetical protein
MKLKLLHGRKLHDEELNGWGFDGPTLLNVIYVHATYQTSFTIGFKDKEAAMKAHYLTHWPFADDCVLHLLLADELVKTKDGYFGDWELQEDNFGTDKPQPGDLSWKDPKSNETRAANAKASLMYHVTTQKLETFQDSEEEIIDLMTDLLHYVKSKDLHLTAIVDQAVRNWQDSPKECKHEREHRNVTADGAIVDFCPDCGKNTVVNENQPVVQSPHHKVCTHERIHEALTGAGVVKVCRDCGSTGR